jgi:hypothetical protein
VKCNSSNLVYNYTSSEALTLDIRPSLIVNTVTTLNSPRTGIIGTTSNKLTYRLFTGAPLTGDYFCGATTPATPNKSAMDCREWTAVSGIIEVTTTTNTAFKHTIVLKKTLKVEIAPFY